MKTMEQIIKWHYISEEGLPKLTNNKPKAFLICYKVELGYKLDDKTIIPSNEFINSCTIALIQNKKSNDGFAYTPKLKFYWGVDIFDTAYAWAEFPEAIPDNR